MSKWIVAVGHLSDGFGFYGDPFSNAVEAYAWAANNLGEEEPYVVVELKSPEWAAVTSVGGVEAKLRQMPTHPYRVVTQDVWAIEAGNEDGAAAAYLGGRLVKREVVSVSRLDDTKWGEAP